MQENHLDLAFTRGLFDDEPDDLIQETNEWLTDRCIDWHITQSAEPMFEFLGMTWDEYKLWVTDPHQIPIRIINDYLRSH